MMPLLKYRKGLENIKSYAPAKSLETIKQELGLDNIIKLSANENRLGCSPRVSAAIQQAAATVNMYPDPSCTRLRNKLAEFYGLKPENIILGNGSFELLSLVAQAFIEPGEETIIPDPSFGWYKTSTLLMEGLAVSIPLKDYALDLEETAQRVNDKTRIIWLCNPNNPTGSIISNIQLQRFLTQIPEDVIVVLDEAYYEYVTDPYYPDSVKLLDSHPNIIVLRTFSKVYGLASLRVGYGIASPPLIALLNKIRLPINVNALAQAAALAALEDQVHKQACIDSNCQGKEFYYQSFNEMNLEYIPTETNFIMADIAVDSTAAANELLKRGISVRAGAEYGMPTFLRITIGKPEENLLVINKLKEVLNFLALS